MPFDTTAAETARRSSTAAAAGQDPGDLISTGKTGGLILVVVLALFIAVKKGRKEERTPVDIGELTVLREQLGHRGVSPARRRWGRPRPARRCPPVPAIAQAERAGRIPP